LYDEDISEHFVTMALSNVFPIGCKITQLFPVLVMLCYNTSIAFNFYPSFPPQDINKFLWMVRIGGSTPEGKHIKVRTM
jgi:hypothetical protein